jgi:hypothetical protein
MITSSPLDPSHVRLSVLRHFHLEPRERPAFSVGRALIFADQPLVPALDHLGPRREAIRLQAPGRKEEHLVVFQHVLELLAALPQGAIADVARAHSLLLAGAFLAPASGPQRTGAPSRFHSPWRVGLEMLQDFLEPQVELRPGERWVPIEDEP